MSARSLPIIGVMPPGFEYPEQTQIWVPSAVNLAEESRENRAWSAIALITLAVLIVRAMPEPYRGMIDGAVAAALSIGVASMLSAARRQLAA